MTAAGPATNGTVTFTANSVTYTANVEGTDSFPYTVSDGSLTASSTVKIAPPNLPPVANDQTVSTAVVTAVVITLTATDADGPPPLTFAIATPPSNGSPGGLDPTSGAITYTPRAGFAGTDSFTFTAADAGGAVSAPATVTLNVTAAATDTVRITVALWEASSNGRIVVGASSTGAPAAVLTAQLTLPDQTVVNLGTLNRNGALYFAVESNFSNPGGGTVTVTSSLGGSATRAVTIRP